MADVNKKQRERRGAALVETAIVIILLCSVTFGALEYGWFFLKASYVTNAARQGARVGARADGTIADVNAAVLSALTLGNMQSSNYTVTRVPDDPASLSPGAPFQVTVTVQYAGVGGVGLDMLIMDDIMPANIVSRMVMAREGP